MGNSGQSRLRLPANILTPIPTPTPGDKKIMTPIPTPVDKKIMTPIPTPTPLALTPIPTPPPMICYKNQCPLGTWLRLQLQLNMLTLTTAPTPVVKKELTPVLTPVIKKELTLIPTPTPMWPKMESAPGSTPTPESELPIFDSDRILSMTSEKAEAVLFMSENRTASALSGSHSKIMSQLRCPTGIPVTTLIHPYIRSTHYWMALTPILNNCSQLGCLVLCC